MTVRERVLVNRLIEKIDGYSSFAYKIGVTYQIAGVNKAKVQSKQESKPGKYILQEGRL